jgi:hypothetical protein
MSDDDDEDEWIRQKSETYMRGMKTFIRQERSGQNDVLLREVHGKSPEARARLVIDSYEQVLWDLHDRPAGKFCTAGGLDELDLFCRALRFGWRLWPDSWTGMLMMLDYVAEKFLPDDIHRLDSETLETIKEIARTKSWPNNPFGGSMQAAAAKTILARHSRHVSFEEATTIEVVRRMAPFNCTSDNVDGWTKLLASMSMPPSQPERRKPTQFFDQRRHCDAVFCTNVEQGTVKFKKCSRCKQEAYCSKQCQIASWKCHKKHCSAASE